MCRKIQYLVLCIVLSPFHANYTAAAVQYCKIRVTNNISFVTYLAVYNGGDRINALPLATARLTKGESWDTKCYGDTEINCPISWTSEPVVKRHPGALHKNYKVVDVACGSTYNITTETSGYQDI